MLAEIFMLRVENTIRRTEASSETSSSSTSDPRFVPIGNAPRFSPPPHMRLAYSAA